MRRSFPLRRTLRSILAGLTLVACKGHPPPQDTDAELFRTPVDLTRARMLNLSKWTADFVRINKHLPADLVDVRQVPAAMSAEDSAWIDGWTHPIVYSRGGAGFELRSAGPDTTMSTDDDLVLRVVNPLTVN